MSKRLHARGIKKHHPYTLEEIADFLSVHVQTVRGWGKAGLPIMRGRKPYIVVGEDVIDFLEKRNLASKRPLGPNEVYCLPCRRPVKPAGGFAEFCLDENGTSRLIGMCPRCDALIHRYVRAESIRVIAPDLEIVFANGEASLTGSSLPLSNTHFKDEKTS